MLRKESPWVPPLRGSCVALPGFLGVPTLLPQSRFAPLGHRYDPGTTSYMLATALTLAPPTSTHLGRNRGLSCPVHPHRLQGCDKSL